MSFIRIYAVGSLIVALLKILEGCLALALTFDLDQLAWVRTAVEILWLVASIIALLVFPVCKTSVVSPVTYLLYNVGKMVLRLSLTLGSVESEVPGWVHYIKVTNTHALHYATIAFGVFYAGINVLLLLHLNRGRTKKGE